MKTAMQEFSEWLKAYEYELPLELQVKAREALIKESVQLFEFWNGGIKSTEEAGKSFDQYINTNGLSIDEILSYKTPIELPSDDEISKEASNNHYGTNFKHVFANGAKWMKEQILNQNK